MAFSTLDDIPTGARVFVDSTIFIYHFTEASPQCRTLLERCESREVRGLSSALVLAEVAHRLMTIEAVRTGRVTGVNLPKKLRARPDVVKTLHLYQDAVDRIPLMGIEVGAVDLGVLLASRETRTRYGLLVNDSLVAVSARAMGATVLATADSDFGRIDGIAVYRPRDIAVPRR